MKTFTTAVLSVLVVAAAVVLAFGDQARERELQQAIDLIESKGDLTAATPLLEDVAKSADRGLAARGLLYLAQAQERTGNDAALATYRRIVSDFGGVTEVAATAEVAAIARTKLAAMGQKGSGLVASLVWDQDGGNAVSPDGTYLTFTDAHGDLGVHDLVSGRDRMLTKEAKGKDIAAFFPVPSPDSRLIVYVWFDKKEHLRVIGRDGGQPRVVYPNDENADALCSVGWSPDGKWILATVVTAGNAASKGTDDLVLIPAGGGAKRLVKRFEGGDGLRPGHFRMSPDGRSVAYDRRLTPGKPGRNLFSLSLDTGREVPILTSSFDDYMLDWFPAGDRILFATDRGGVYGIWAARIVDGRAAGDPMPIRSGTGSVQSNGFTRKGDFYYFAEHSEEEIYLASLDPTTGRQLGHLTRLESRFIGGKTQSAWSPDGDRIIYVRIDREIGGSNQAPLSKLAIQTLSTGDVHVLTPGPFYLREPAWLPDGRSVIVRGNVRGQDGLFLVNVETGALKTIADLGGVFPGALPRSFLAISPDGQGVFYRRSPNNVVVRDLISGVEQAVTAQPVESFALSPDGRWLAVTRPLVRQEQSLQQDRHLFVIPTSGGEPRPLAPVLGTWQWILNTIAWSQDGRFVYVVKVGPETPSPRRDEIWQVPVDGTAPRNTGITWNGGIARISAHPDGRLALSTGTTSPETWVLQNLPAQREK